MFFVAYLRVLPFVRGSVILLEIQWRENSLPLYNNPSYRVCKMSTAQQKYCIIGQPLGHSMSPAFHTEAFAQLKHDGEFTACPLDAESIADFITAMREGAYQGACVTIPHKKSVFSFVDEVTPRAKSVGAVNTLYMEGSTLWGDNTDVQGFLYPLQDRKVPSRAMIFGAGGAARAIIVGLKQLRSAGMQKIFITARELAQAEALSEEFNLVPVEWEKRHTIKAPWMINTTPLGMQGALLDESPYTAKALVQNLAQNPDKNSLAYDIVYNPLETRFLREAKAAGWQVQDGLDMFVGQALEQEKIWLGRSADFVQMRSFVEKLLGV